MFWSTTERQSCITTILFCFFCRKIAALLSGTVVLLVWCVFTQASNFPMTKLINHRRCCSSLYSFLVTIDLMWCKASLYNNYIFIDEYIFESCNCQLMRCFMIIFFHITVIWINENVLLSLEEYSCTCRCLNIESTYYQHTDKNITNLILQQLCSVCNKRMNEIRAFGVKEMERLFKVDLLWGKFWHWTAS